MSARLTRQQVATMRRMRREGYRAKDVAWEFGVSLGTVNRYTRGYGTRAFRKPKPSAPDDPAREAEIVRRAKEGETLTSIGKTLHPPISRERARMIVAGYEARTGDRVPRHDGAARPGKTKPALEPSRKTVAQRIAGLVRVERDTGCWTWVGALFTAGGKQRPTFGGGCSYYHKLPGRSQYVQRVAYTMWRGPIPTNKAVGATCGNELCVNPFHLELQPMGRRPSCGAVPRHA